jgi:hypothetical protein
MSGKPPKTARTIVTDPIGVKETGNCCNPLIRKVSFAICTVRTNGRITTLPGTAGSCQKRRMASATKWSGPRPLGEFAARVIDPAVGKRGFATAELLASWDTIVGARNGAFTQPEKLTFARGQSGGGVLTIRVDGPRAIFLQHEAGQLIARINTFLGFTAVAELRFVQKPLSPKARRPEAPPQAPIPAQLATALDEAVSTVDGDPLREALRRLGEGVIRDRLARP